MNHSEYMDVAIKEAYEGIKAKHGGPFGSVIVKDNKIIGKGHNSVMLLEDPTCHGEMMAIRDACKNIGSHSLEGCTLYTTAAPCPMCKGAILWANIKDVYYGCNVNDTDNIGFRDEVFYNNWTEEDNFGSEAEREACLKLFEDYASMEHELY